MVDTLLVNGCLTVVSLFVLRETRSVPLCSCGLRSVLNSVERQLTAVPFFGDWRRVFFSVSGNLVGFLFITEETVLLAKQFPQFTPVLDIIYKRCLVIATS